MKNPSQILDILEKYYKNTQKTTLNSMREKQTDNFGNSTPFKILISCLLSLRTKDEITEVISKNLFNIADTPEKLIKIPDKQLEKIIFSTGHYKKKTQIIKHVSKELIKKYNSKVPKTKQELLSIKGIGPKTANIVLCFAYNQLVIPVDINVHRVSNRLGIVNAKTPEKTEEQLEKILPKKYWREINGLFILHGKKICVPISPKCSVCPIEKYCPKQGVIKSR